MDVDVVVVGAGPVGLTLANILGLQGVSTLVVEERDTLIDYPRGVGLDDESLRTFQAIGLVERVLPHTVPNQILRFVDAKRRILAEMAPPDARFGWPKRNGFVQPLVDAELLRGLERFEHVEVQWGQADGVLHRNGRRGHRRTRRRRWRTKSVRARYVVGCDGGRSATRRLMGVSFDGTTSPTRWLVVDVANDPLGHPNSEVGADPARPYASISIAHGIRRFEFMIHADETDEQAEDPAFLTRMLASMVPHPDRVDVIRHRLYTHHSRIAGAFRQGRLLLAGDAAHLMPVWQGQGYNSGIRDATNLGWKLAAVVNGYAEDASARHLRRRASQACPGDDRPVDDGGPGHLADQSPRRRGPRPAGAIGVNCALAQAICARDAVQADAAIRAGRRRASRAAAGGFAGRDVVRATPGRHPRAAERPARRCARRWFRRDVLEQQAAGDPRRQSICGLAGVGCEARGGSAADPAALGRRRRSRRGGRR